MRLFSLSEASIQPRYSLPKCRPQTSCTAEVLASAVPLPEDDAAGSPGGCGWIPRAHGAAAWAAATLSDKPAAEAPPADSCLP